MKQLKNKLWTVAASAFTVVGATLLFTVSASAAYIDAAAFSMGLTAIVAAVVAVGSVFFIWWRKFRHKVSKTLGIDENAHKEVEEDIVINDDSEDKTPAAKGSDTQKK